MPLEFSLYILFEPLSFSLPDTTYMEYTPLPSFESSIPWKDVGTPSIREVCAVKQNLHASFMYLLFLKETVLEAELSSSEQNV